MPDHIGSFNARMPRVVVAGMVGKTTCRGTQLDTNMFSAHMHFTHPQHSDGLSAPRAGRALVVVALAMTVLATGCSTVRTASSQLASPETMFGVLKPYRIEVVQGNVVTQETMAQIQPGLGRQQVRDILGAPVLADIFHDNRWDYVFTIAKQGIAPQQRKVSLFFKGNVLERIEADPLPTEREFVASVERPDADASKARTPDLTPEQIAALPVPTKPAQVRRSPQGAARDYPPLEAGRP